MPVRVNSVGPKSAKIALFGEALGAEEERRGEPFVGKAGKRLDRILENSGLIRSELYISNVIKERPPDNNIKKFIDLSSTSVKVTDAYLEYEKELYEEITGLEANVLVALGNIPLYALTRLLAKITVRRGSVYWIDDERLKGKKVVACLHPSYLERINDSLTDQITGMDFQRIKEQSLFPESPLPERKYIIRPTFYEVLEYLDACRSVKLVSYDIEVSSFNQEMSCISFSTGSDSAISIPFATEGRDYFSPYQERDIWKAIAVILEDESIVKANQNIGFDATFVYQRTGIASINLRDTMVAHGVLAPDFKKDLGFLTSLYSFEPYYKDEGSIRFKTGGGTDETFWLYNAKDSVVIHDILPKIESDLQKTGNYQTYIHQCKVLEPAIYMMCKGFSCDYKGMQEESVLLKQEAAELEVKLSELTHGHVTNSRSSQQLCSYFYGIKRIAPVLKAGKPTADEKALKKLAGRGHPEARVALEARRKLNRCSKFLDINIDTDGRLRGSINVVGATTGRWSISKTLITQAGFNLQTPPKPVRRYILADEGSVIIDVDLEQAENRIVAHIAPEPTMMNAFNANMDIHALTGSLLSGLPYEEVMRQDRLGIPAPIGDELHTWRYWGKKCDHAFNYGEGPFRFAVDCEIEMSEGKRLKNRYFNIYPGIRMFHLWVDNELNRNNRTLINPYGRRRSFRDRFSDHMKRQAYNFYPQSTVADKIDRDGIELIYYNQQWFSGVEMLNQMHDSITMQLDLSRPWMKHAEALLRLKDSLARPIVWRALEIRLPVGASMGLNLQETYVEIDPETGEETRKNKTGLHKIDIWKTNSATLLSIKLKTLYEQLRCAN